MWQQLAHFDPAPLLMAVVLGDRIELNFRRALEISDGDYSTFFHGTAVRVLLTTAALLLALQAAIRILGYRNGADGHIERKNNSNP